MQFLCRVEILGNLLLGRWLNYYQAVHYHSHTGTHSFLSPSHCSRETCEQFQWKATQMPLLTSKNVATNAHFHPGIEDSTPITSVNELFTQFGTESKRMWSLAGPAIFTAVCRSRCCHSNVRRPRWNSRFRSFLSRKLGHCRSYFVNIHLLLCFRCSLIDNRTNFDFSQNTKVSPFINKN